MDDDFHDAVSSSARAKAVQRALDTKPNINTTRSPRKLLKEVQAAENPAPEPNQKRPKEWAILELKVRVISALHDVVGLTFGQIDKILHWTKGTSRNLSTKYPEIVRLCLQEFSDKHLELFFRNKISVLDSLMAGAPNTVKLLTEVQNDSTQSLDTRMRAGDRIFDWTKMILTTKNPEKAKKVLGEDLRKHADEADETLDMLRDNLGGLVGDEPN